MTRFSLEYTLPLHLPHMGQRVRKRLTHLLGALFFEIKLFYFHCDRNLEFPFTDNSAGRAEIGIGIFMKTNRNGYQVVISILALPSY